MAATHVDAPWMLYGANGYTGQLILERALARGHRPILAGRSAAKLNVLATRHGLTVRVFELDRPNQVAEQLEDVAAVVHAAGPFSHTAQPMVQACLLSATHYLDITGEIDVFEMVHARHEDARLAGIALLPGVGFDVVPTDCLAARLADALPGATSLELAFRGGGGTSVGTTKTMVESLGERGRARIDGEIRDVPVAWRTREVPFADKSRSCVSIPWGDVSTAYYSTGIGNITTYLAMSPRAMQVLKLGANLRGVLGLPAVQRGLKWLVDKRVQSPDADARERTVSQVWGEVRHDDGRRVSGTLTTPNGYKLTAHATVAALERVLHAAGDADGPALRGALTPSMAFGPEFVELLDGVIGPSLREH
ncbi:MAG: NAD(P)H-binding protein [Myxococcales bacterium]|nr:NAD(P)H-binding protein [Myxococcales bacterium]